MEPEKIKIDDIEDVKEVSAGEAKEMEDERSPETFSYISSIENPKEFIEKVNLSDKTAEEKAVLYSKILGDLDMAVERSENLLNAERGKIKQAKSELGLESESESQESTAISGLNNALKKIRDTRMIVEEELQKLKTANHENEAIGKIKKNIAELAEPVNRLSYVLDKRNMDHLFTVFDRDSVSNLRSAATAMGELAHKQNIGPEDLENLKSSVSKIISAFDKSADEMKGRKGPSAENPDSLGILATSLDRFRESVSSVSKQISIEQPKGFEDIPHLMNNLVSKLENFSNFARKRRDVFSRYLGRRY